MPAYRALTIKPKDGGHLITRASSSEVGLANYTVKRDWRRNLERERRREGHDHFWGNQSKALGQQPFPNWPSVSEPIVLVHLARRPNGKHAIIVGTETKLWRFFSMDDDDYVLGDGNGIYVEGDANGPYFVDQNGDWQLIGSGFKSWAEGAHRWEAVNINGYTIFNNGADLPQQYRLEWDWVRPLYELREQGIARVGTIGDYADCLFCGDITEINENLIDDQFALADSGAITAEQTGSEYSGLTVASQAAGGFTVTTAGGSFAFDAGMVGKELLYTNGFKVEITGFTDANTVTVDRAPVNAITGRPFWVIDDADYLVNASGAFFTSDMVGKRMLWDTGQVRRIAAVLSGTQVRVETHFGIAAGAFAVENTTAYEYYAGGSVDRRHWRVMWSLPQEPARFGASTPCSLAQGSNVIVMDYPVESFEIGQEVSIVDENFEVASLTRSGTTATAVTKQDHGYVNGNSVKISGADQTEYNGIFQVFNVTAKSFQFTVSGAPLTPATSPTGKIIAGAGILTGTILSITAMGTRIALDVTAEEPFNNGKLVRSDVSGSILGYEDLQEDSSGILRMLELSGALVIYKDSSIVLATYTGLPEAPFRFQARKVPSEGCLHYRWTLVSVRGEWHLYAGRDGFFRFDTTAQNPQELQLFDWVKNTFFDVAIIDATNAIFAADNGVTKEIMIVFAADDSYAPDGVIFFDYKYNTLSTSGIRPTAAATVKRPESGLSQGETEDWFVMGGASGDVLLYGLVHKALPQFGNGKEIFYRRDGTDTELKNGYDSVLQTGLEDFGDLFNEKDLAAFVLHLASQSTTDVTLLFELFGALNAVDGTTLLTSKLMDAPKRENLVPVFYRQNAFQGRLTVTSYDNPVEIVAQVWNISGVRSESITRRPAV